MRKKTSQKQKESKHISLKEHKPFTSKELNTPELVAEVLLDCIKTDDLNAFREVLTAHLLTVNKTQIAKKAGIGRRTLYDLLDFKKDFNPELSTISALIRALSAA